MFTDWDLFTDTICLLIQSVYWLGFVYWYNLFTDKICLLIGICLLIQSVYWYNLFTDTICLLIGICILNNYNCHNIYWDPLIWFFKNGHLIVLTCISFFNELQFVFMTGRDIHGRTSFVILCNASMKRNEKSATTLLYTYTDIFRWKAKISLHTMLKLTVFMQISCLMRSCCHLICLTLWRLHMHAIV